MKTGKMKKTCPQCGFTVTIDLLYPIRICPVCKRRGKKVRLTPFSEKATEVAQTLSEIFEEDGHEPLESEEEYYMPGGRRDYEGEDDESTTLGEGTEAPGGHRDTEEGGLTD